MLHSDGIGRHPLSDKQFGVFDFTKTADHQLTAGSSDTVRFPHSRWNEVKVNELTASGYLVLTQSAEGGVDSFVKKKKRSLFVHFQGHPEYGAQTLLKEYRRDIKRYLRAERETYPSMPKGYFERPLQVFKTPFEKLRCPIVRKEPSRVFLRPLSAHSRRHGIGRVNGYCNWLLYV